jgi:hypothetical protein
MKKVKVFEEFIDESSSVNESFERLPKSVIGFDLRMASRKLNNFYENAKDGYDIEVAHLDNIIKDLTAIKKSVKKFSKEEDIKGTVYEQVDSSINGINEGKTTVVIHYNTDDDDLRYVSDILKKAGIKATVLAGLDSEEIEVTIEKSDLKKATKALSADGLELQESIINEAVKVEVSLRHARHANELFDDMFKDYGKKLASDVFSFKDGSGARDFIRMMIKNLQIPAGEITADQKYFS